MDFPVTASSSLQDKDKDILRKAGYEHAASVLLSSQDDVVKKTKLSSSEVDGIIGAISREILAPPQKISSAETYDQFTTGDQALDGILGGGIRTGTVWEIAGEGASGKSQLAFQAALTVQMPVDLGGLEGSVCYITAGSALATSRLEQLISEHPLLSPDHCSLSDIHSCSVEIPQALTYYLREALPNLIETLNSTPGAKPLKLIIIDSIGALLRSRNKTDTNQLVERSKSLAEVSRLLHGLAATRGLAALVINDVTSVFEREKSNDNMSDELIYWEQSRWFGRPDDTYWDEKKEASLGLVWANQLNVRLFMTRTGRMKTVDLQTPASSPDTVSEEENERSKKRRKLDLPPATKSTTSILLRRLDVIFSPFVRAQSIDFILTPSGLRTIPPLLSTNKPTTFFGYEAKVDGSLPLDPPSSEADHPDGKSVTVADLDLMADIDYDAYWDEDLEGVEIPEAEEPPVVT